MFTNFCNFRRSEWNFEKDKFNFHIFYDLHTYVDSASITSWSHEGWKTTIDESLTPKSSNPTFYSVFFILSFFHWRERIYTCLVLSCSHFTSPFLLEYAVQLLKCSSSFLRKCELSDLFLNSNKMYVENILKIKLTWQT